MIQELGNRLIFGLVYYVQDLFINHLEKFTFTWPFQPIKFASFLSLFSFKGSHFWIPGEMVNLQKVNLQKCQPMHFGHFMSGLTFGQVDFWR